MSRKGINKMSIKILQLCLVLVSAFNEFVKFSLSTAAQLLKSRLQTKSLLKQKYFDRNLCNIFLTGILHERKHEQFH